MPYLIDGHNLIARLPDIQLDDPDDEAQLVLKLRGFAARTRKKCIVVFDQGLPGGKSSLSTSQVKVIFASSQHTNADRIIMERIRETRDARNWTVVSSDQEVLDAARRAGMKPMHCEDFADRLVRVRHASADPGEAANPYVSPSEVADWMREFGTQDPTNECAAPIPPEPKPTHPPDPAKSEVRKANKQQPAASATTQTQTTPSPEPARAKPNNRPKHRYPRRSANPPPSTDRGEAEHPDISDDEINEFLAIFGDDAADTSDQRPPRHKSRQQATTSAAESNKARKGRQRNTPTPRKIDKRGEADDFDITQAEVDEWLAIFGTADDDEA